MRPLDRPAWRPEWEGLQRPGEVALAALGRYCATCERRLPQDVYAWHATTGELVEDAMTADDWPHVLPLCGNCAAAATSNVVIPLESMLLPHRDVTFTLADGSPFTYATAPVTARLTAEAGVGEVERAVAVAHTMPATQTVVRFALNTHVIGIGQPHPSTLARDLETLDFWDPRHELRTSATRDAHTAAGLLERSASQPDLTDVLLEQTGVLAEHSGFWSVWASVLSRVEVVSRERLAALLTGPAFPATRAGVLG